jgi:hypothetical protein
VVKRLNRLSLKIFGLRVGWGSEERPATVTEVKQSATRAGINEEGPQVERSEYVVLVGLYLGLYSRERSEWSERFGPARDERPFA